jgi:5-amino-6-(5-phospho-D-ribitylamino)uracil phosphatase
MNLYVSDLDGTLLNSEYKITNRSVEIINNLIDKGLYFTIATARSLNSSEKLLSNLKLKLPLILRNGVIIYDPVKRENIQINYIEGGVLLPLILGIEKFNISPLIFSESINSNKIYYKFLDNNKDSLFIKDKLYTNDKRLQIIKNYNEIPLKNINTFIILEKNKIFLNEIYLSLKNVFELEFLFYEDIYSEYYILEICSKNANKRQGVKFLKEYLNVDRIICFGDNFNDYSMFEYSDEKYAVSNAVPELQKISTAIIKSNNEDGVALFLEKHFN